MKGQKQQMKDESCRHSSPVNYTEKEAGDDVLLSGITLGASCLKRICWRGRIHPFHLLSGPALLKQMMIKLNRIWAHLSVGPSPERASFAL